LYNIGLLIFNDFKYKTWIENDINWEKFRLHYEYKVDEINKDIEKVNGILKLINDDTIVNIKDIIDTVNADILTRYVELSTYLDPNGGNSENNEMKSLFNEIQMPIDMHDIVKISSLENKRKIIESVSPIKALENEYNGIIDEKKKQLLQKMDNITNISAFVTNKKLEITKDINEMVHTNFTDYNIITDEESAAKIQSLTDDIDRIKNDNKISDKIDLLNQNIDTIGEYIHTINLNYNTLYNQASDQIENEINTEVLDKIQKVYKEVQKISNLKYDINDTLDVYSNAADISKLSDVAGK